jgi:hypothetical protein
MSVHCAKAARAAAIEARAAARAVEFDGSETALQRFARAAKALREARDAAWRFAIREAVCHEG